MDPKHVYVTRTTISRRFFAARGLNAITTAGDMIKAFQCQPGITPDPENNMGPRILFHDMAHVLSNQFESSLRSEEIAAIYETVYMHGPYSASNKADQSLFEGREGLMPSTMAKARHYADYLVKFANRQILRNGTPNLGYEPKYQRLSDDEFARHFQQAVHDEAFFSKLSGGRVLNMFSAQDMLDTPLVQFGLIKSADSKPAVQRIPQAMRDAALAYVEAHELSLHIANRKKSAVLRFNSI